MASYGYPSTGSGPGANNVRYGMGGNVTSVPSSGTYTGPRLPIPYQSNTEYPQWPTPQPSAPTAPYQPSPYAPTNITPVSGNYNDWGLLSPDQVEKAIGYNQQMLPWAQMDVNERARLQELGINQERWDKTFAWQKYVEGSQLAQAQDAQKFNQYWLPEELTRQQGWQTGENTAARTWQTSERQGTQDWQGAQNLGQQQWQTGERQGNEAWQGAQNTQQQGWQAAQNQAAQGWQSAERLGTQDWQGAQNLGQQAWQTGERTGQQGYQTAENLAARGWQTGERQATNVWQGVENEQSRQLAREQMAAEGEIASLNAFGRRMRPSTRWL